MNPSLHATSSSKHLKIPKVSILGNRPTIKGGKKSPTEEEATKLSRAFNTLKIIGRQKLEARASQRGISDKHPRLSAGNSGSVQPRYEGKPPQR